MEQAITIVGGSTLLVLHIIYSTTILRKAWN